MKINPIQLNPELRAKLSGAIKSQKETKRPEVKYILDPMQIARAELGKYGLTGKTADVIIKIIAPEIV